MKDELKKNYKLGFIVSAAKHRLIDENGIDSWSYWLSKKQINKLFAK